MLIRFALALLCSSSLLPTLWAQNPPALPAAAEPSTDPAIYGQGVRETPWRSPQQQRAGFHLPPGFEIRCFASEPQIAKPLNIAPDARGRLWITQTTRYPHPRPLDSPDDGSAADAVLILEDADGDGSAERVTTFADGLNIPIGILPYGDGCLCFSIPHIWYLRDTDGDGRCDRREKLFGPFDTTRDTHGMVNALRDGGDGWIYACHGFNNQSEVRGRDGHTVRLHSGNTFRFRPDGSRIEQVTQGQVNPFGTTTDDWGYRYSADCHSKPITQLIDGACYPSFGRPHDGLGFLPPMVHHLHGSTAISGIAYVSGRSAWQPLRGQMLSGNVMTSRLNRNAVDYTGATARGTEMPDFLTSDDPWFRPVDLRFGPDGHLYVADFYNSIIGHYEVPLDHPQRDRTSGRIWQIRYVGGLPAADATAAGADESIAAARGRLGELNRAANPATENASSPALQRIREALQDPSPHVVRRAAELLGRRGEPGDIPRLLRRLVDVPDEDVVLRQSLRIASARLLRRTPADSPHWRIAATEPPPVAAAFLDILPAVDHPAAAAALLDYVAASDDPAAHHELFALAASRASNDQLERCVELAQEIAGEHPIHQREWLERIWTARNLRAGRVPAAIAAWARPLAASQLEDFLDLLSPPSPRLAGPDGEAVVLDWTSSQATAWPLEERPVIGSRNKARVSSSFALGESYTGRQWSTPFAAPEEIRFRLAGHDGPPSKPALNQNFVRLVDAVTGDELFRALPPRSDVTAQIQWDTSRLAGRLVRIECIDGDAGDAYAWIAIGDFQPFALDLVSYRLRELMSDGLASALQWSQRLGDDDMADRLDASLDHEWLSGFQRRQIAVTLASLGGHADAHCVLRALAQRPWPATDAFNELHSAAGIRRLAQGEEAAIRAALTMLAEQLTTAEQHAFALDWTRQGGSTRRLLDLLHHGTLAIDVLADDELWQSLDARLAGANRTLAEELRGRALAAASPRDQRAARLATELPRLRGNAVRGLNLFRQHCAACHQLDGQGTVLGPQLDGAVARPPQRLLEDILAPNRNVDEAFRTTSILTIDGEVFVGLVQHEDDDVVHLYDAQGKQHILATDDIELRKRSARSLMPEDLGDSLSDQQLADLLAFLRAGQANP
ncbi:PVC-type heme-binding CxxCH protein [Roseimaritima sediminicola]|uniref:PVC-type heme-binding CxxCH protein n=1 Tax=Roseimaritima sediminicola TaxID=2662066 RepID=UPI001386C16F|nr:PVC-type heme-binding CxxCH protein [Roseimaritima sediminicola]